MWASAARPALAACPAQAVRTARSAARQQRIRPAAGHPHPPQPPRLTRLRQARQTIMAASSFSSDDDDALMTEINMTPLVDVMLVLLIVFLVTIPVIRHAVKIDLPHASSQKEETKPVQVNVSIEADGTVLWDEKPVSNDDLRAKIAQAAQAEPQPELHLNADRKVAYEKVAEVMSAAQA